LIGELIRDQGHKLVVMANLAIPVEISSEEVKTETHHEEADNTNVQQVLKCRAKAVSVISDDTDVFILLFNYYQKANLAIPNSQSPWNNLARAQSQLT